MKQYPSAPNQLMLEGACLAEGGYAQNIAPDATHGTLYRPAEMLARSREADKLAVRIEEQNARAALLDDIASEDFRAIAQAALADRQTETFAKLTALADTIPYETIGGSLIILARRRAVLTRRVEAYHTEKTRLKAELDTMVQQVESIVGTINDDARDLAAQQFEAYVRSKGHEGRIAEEHLKGVLSDQAISTALYPTLWAWPIARVRRPARLPVIRRSRPEAQPIKVTPGSRGERMPDYSHPHIDEPLQFLATDMAVLPEWRAPYTPSGIAEVIEESPYDPDADAVLEELYAAEQETFAADAPYDPDFDLEFHRLNGTKPPKTTSEKVIELADQLRLAESSGEARPIMATELTQHQRIAAFLIANAGKTLSALDIGAFLYHKDGEPIDVTFVTNKARTLLGPQAHGKKVLSAMLLHNFCIQYGTKRINLGKAKKMRVYRGLSLGLTVLPKDGDATIAWEPPTTK
ncbi:MAG TPA: hypothetical protein VF733_00685 [Candidatus Saccharimonadales bacterium]